MTIPRIASFPNDEFVYRIESFGPIASNPHVPSDPTIEVILRRENQNGDLENSWMVIKNTTIALIPYLVFNSRWKNQQRIADHFSVQTRTFKLEINSSTVQTIALEDKFESNGWWFPREVLSFGSTWNRVKGSSFLAVSHNNQINRVVFPMVTLLRAYFAPSSKVAQQLFDNSLSDRIFINLFEEISFEDAECRVRPHNGYTNTEIAILARLFCDPYAMQAAREPLRTYQEIMPLRANQLTQLVPHIKTFFPFQGITHLSCRGRWFQGGDNASHFLVHNIDSCSHPMPYAKLTITKSQAVKADNNQAKDYRASTSSSSDGHDGDTISNIEEPNKNLRDRFEVLKTTAYPDLKNKIELNLEPGKPIQRRKRKHQTLDNPEDYSTGGIGKTTGEHSPFGFKSDGTSEDRDVPDLFAHLITCVTLLTDRGFSCCQILLNTEEDAPQFSYFPVSVNGRDFAWSWLRLNLRRRALVIEAQRNDDYLYVIETERRPSEEFTLVARSSRGKLPRQSLEGMLELGVIVRGIWRKRLPTNSPWKAFKHSSVRLQEQVRKLEGLLED
jgi:hypothetical protein